MIDRIIAKLQRLDQQIKNTEAEAQVNRQGGNLERAIFLDGRKDGLSDAYRSLKSLVEGTPELAQREGANEVDTVILVIDEKLAKKLKQSRLYENAGQPDIAKINTDADLIIQLINNAHDAMKLTKLGQKVLQ